MKPESRKLIMTALAGLISVWSIFLMYSNAPFYIEISKATQGMEVSLIEFQRVNDTRILLTFEFENISSLDITLNNLIFNLYANSEFMGNFGMTEMKKTLPPGITAVVVVADVQERYMEELPSDQTIQWYVHGGAVIQLPIEEEVTYNIPISTGWVT
ncbi:MAG: hypothetical protein HXS53_07335 [Theionarchaea archaeon]|nr:hypothetical protein [Theionarchaea archaeon]